MVHPVRGGWVITYVLETCLKAGCMLSQIGQPGGCSTSCVFDHQVGKPPVIPPPSYVVLIFGDCLFVLKHLYLCRFFAGRQYQTLGLWLARQALYH